MIFLSGIDLLQFFFYRYVGMVVSPFGAAVGGLFVGDHSWQPPHTT